MRDGELSTSARIRTAAAALTAQTVAFPHLIGRRYRSDASLNPTPPPDSRMCRDAWEEARTTLATPILTHSLRSWEFAQAFAQVDNREFDAESLYVATMLHDVRLGSVQDDSVGCFALLGADHARRFVSIRGGSEEQATCVHTAIARHMDVRTPAGNEAALLHDAAHLDVAGLRVQDLDRARVACIESAYPRAGFRAAFGSAMRTESQLRPLSTAGTLWRSGMPLALLLNPLERSARA